MDQDLKQQIANEELVAQKLNSLNIRIESWAVATKNAFLKERSKEYQEWQQIGQEIKEASLTPEGRLRLEVKHELIRDRISPRHSVLILSLAPLAVFWVLKKGLTWLVTKRLEEYQKQQARNRRRLEQAKEKRDRLASKGLIQDSHPRNRRK